MKKVLSSKRRFKLELEVKRMLELHQMVPPGDHVLVAISGGADSVALLNVLQRLATGLRFRLSAAHLNHQLRGADATRDEEFVRKTCAAMNVPLTVGRIPVRQRARERKQNLEEAAREARYAFLFESAQKLSASKIALGHNMNDQAETVLMRLFRGTGPEGLAAIPPIREGRFIRPLLETRRSEIESYLRMRGKPWREDKSNRSLRFQRNRIRLELIPYLKKHFNPQIVPALARYARLSGEISTLLEECTTRAYSDLHESSASGVTLNAPRMATLGLALQKSILRRALKESRSSLRGITDKHIQAIHQLCAPNSSGRIAQLPGGWIARRQFDALDFLQEHNAESHSFSYEITIPGSVVVREAGVEIDARIGAPPATKPAEVGTNEAYLQLPGEPRKITIRSRLPGDRYGGPRSRKVKKLLIDARIPLARRNRLPIVESNGRIIWIPGLPPPKAYRVGSPSNTCLILTVKERRNS